MDRNSRKLDIFEPDQTDERAAIGHLLQRAKDKKVEYVRRDGTYQELKLFAEACLSAVMMNQVWKMNFVRVKISQFVTLEDEALALLILENNVEEWIEQAERKEGEKPAKKRRLTRYTGKGRKIDGTKKGWSLEGKERFNAIFDVLEKERKSETSKQREDNLMKDWGGERDDKDLKLRAAVVTDNAEQLKKEMERIREEEKFVPRCSYRV